eukprot:TRINITY_DN9695_c0_g1_i1.p1 TRINITY_DN9695_c0_g1~~TRINITY_DN9695_c0_g1_i1.p1  ORF type:complete len:249 (-),score=93.05 TRINITY_DN9695_c0_g1_i1:43-789(-)
MQAKKDALAKKVSRGFVAKHETAVAMDQLEKDALRVPELEAEIARLLMQLGDLEMRLRVLEGDLKDRDEEARVENGKHGAYAANLEDMIAALQKQLAEMAEQAAADKARMQGGLDGLQSALDDSEAATKFQIGTEGENQKLRDEVADLKRLVEQLTLKDEGSQARIKELEESLTATEDQLQQCTTQVEQLTTELGGCHEDIAELRRKLAGSEEEVERLLALLAQKDACLLYTSPSPRDRTRSRMPSSA